ncbi:unnamed protein product, partial [Urochloa humidicola]
MLEAHLHHDFHPGEEEDTAGAQGFHQLRGLPPDNRRQGSSLLYTQKEKAVNVIKFSARALKILSGKLTIEASYSVTSKTRVDIKLESSTITPEQLMNIFQKNYDMLLAIFNPEGWLEITITINQNLLVLAMKLTNSTTIVTALSNLTPQSTFIVAILTRQEVVKLGKASGRAKLAGTLVGLGGAMVVTFYRGPEMAFMHRLAHIAGLHRHDGSNHGLTTTTAAPSAAVRVVGSFL